MPRLFRWEQTFPNRPFPVIANRHDVVGDAERHSHDFMEMVLVVNGTGKHLTMHGDETLQVGRGLVLHPGTWHAYHDCHDLTIYNCCFRLEMLQHEFNWSHDDDVLQRLFWSYSPFHQEAALHRLDLTSEQVALCKSQLESLVALDKQQDFVKVRHLGHFLLFLATFVHPLRQKVYAQGREALHIAVQQSMQLFKEDLTYPWTLAEVAQRVGLDASYLVRLFNANLKLTPMNYLARKRVELGALLLVETNQSIKEIGEQVGWPDANHFARRFRTQMGVSATQYRTMCTSAVVQKDHTHSI